MAEDGSVQSTTTWPIPEFHFSVDITDVGKISCREVSGLDIEYDSIEYRAGDMPGFTKVKMPGLKKSSDVTLKKAIFKDDAKLWNWINQINMNVIKRASVTIALLDESGAPVQSWKLSNAWPKKYSIDGFNAEGTKVAMENIVLTHEGVTIA